MITQNYFNGSYFKAIPALFPELATIFVLHKAAVWHITVAK
jgi:hypothetical protein